MYSPNIRTIYTYIHVCTCESSHQPVTLFTSLNQQQLPVHSTSMICMHSHISCNLHLSWNIFVFCQTRQPGPPMMRIIDPFKWNTHFNRTRKEEEHKTAHIQTHIAFAQNTPSMNSHIRNSLCVSLGINAHAYFAILWSAPIPSPFTIVGVKERYTFISQRTGQRAERGWFI